MKTVISPKSTKSVKHNFIISCLTILTFTTYSFFQLSSLKATPNSFKPNRKVRIQNMLETKTSPTVNKVDTRFQLILID
ncbi:MAG: hypothetical protein CFE21_15670 [Bacteroidetes bacterium B1(2017)]|nr:MAG: hypothetical protein CFE21_15670 [Bacteroidetes bacterium B1(2017)]